MGSTFFAPNTKIMGLKVMVTLDQSEISWKAFNHYLANMSKPSHEITILHLTTEPEIPDMGPWHEIHESWTNAEFVLKNRVIESLDKIGRDYTTNIEFWVIRKENGKYRRDGQCAISRSSPRFLFQRSQNVV